MFRSLLTVIFKFTGVTSSSGSSTFGVYSTFKTVKQLYQRYIDYLSIAIAMDILALWKPSTYTHPISNFNDS